MSHSWSLLGLCLLFYSVQSLLPPSKEELNQLSLSGEKYLDKQIENAITGVKEMKSVMDKSEEDHNNFLTALEKTKQQKEEALKTAQEMESKLEEEQSVCNETMQALWEECKPCLKNTCIKFYSRTCSSGSGLVGRQLEEVLNRSSPISIWIDGENIDMLEKQGVEQSRKFQDLEERYAEVADGVDSIFQDSMRVFDQMRSFPQPKFTNSYSFPWFFTHGGALSRTYRSLGVPHHHFRDMFQPMMDMTRGLFSSLGGYMPTGGDFDLMPSEGDGSVNEDVVVTKPFGNGQMTCREIRRNSAGCIKLREECEKCKAIQSIDCSGKKPLEGPVKEELEAALAMADRLTKEHSKLLSTFEERMFNTSSLLDMFNRQFGWVSALANNTKTKDGIFRIKTVMCNTAEDGKPVDTEVSVKLFDSPPMSFTVPSEIPWSDPRFSEAVAQEALERYKQNTLVVK